MTFHLRAATGDDLPFARRLTHQAMGGYYLQYGLVWSDYGFDVGWGSRENWMICKDDAVLGFISLSRDNNALYIRELHLSENHRKQGAGSWVLEQMVLKARAQGLGLLQRNHVARPVAAIAAGKHQRVASARCGGQHVAVRGPDGAAPCAGPAA